ncbi:undecaprenyl-diphosphate phosphatase [Hymenobacter lutimineralis]|uniref:Undecaprenyl-diphosphatase n=1 Tax=Hymenobacter lutimineralis TaxID=2606448 RepID=A0A5D6V1N2_9BACT|nr:MULTISPECIES: undecaprenyl-diphosphate phosphatase [Hymenobacter]QIX60650.1 undecaprenyl-diphosphate phosphatase [Hymenobacter sp. BT18]TYZ08709.1 undecaprenyl-diphosphate phosphatase [Hymenobacter lutimineralis]
MTYWQALILAIVEGITEFLPVSSTGHMIIASALLGIPATAFTKLYLVVIQLGAILSVLAVYWRRFLQNFDFYLKLLVAFLPVVVVGLTLKKYIDILLESVLVVGVMLLLGGLVLMFVDRWFPQEQPEEGHPVTTPSFRQAFVIGVFQCLAVVPGVSRSAATIIGGLTQRLTRKAAAEFAFFLAMPTMAAAAAKDLLDFYQDGGRLTGADVKLILFGNVVAFVVALLAIRLFIGFVTRFGFRAFGIYRVIVGGILLVMIGLGINLQLL